MILLLVAALACFIVVAVTGFQWFGANLDAVAILGWLGLGFVFMTLYWIIPGVIAYKRPPQ
jgi:hypothetical protein